MNKQVNKRVEKLLKLGQAYRDSDRLLMLALWEEDGLCLTPHQREVFLNKCTTPETITRVRRDLRAKYPESEKVAKSRYKKMKEYRDEYGQPIIFKFGEA